MNVKLGNCKTSAQAVTKICYNEPTRNLDFRIQCKDLEDLKRCVRIIKGYNDFDWEKVNKALDASLVNWWQFEEQIPLAIKVWLFSTVKSYTCSFLFKILIFLIFSYLNCKYLFNSGKFATFIKFITVFLDKCCLKSG